MVKGILAKVDLSDWAKDSWINKNIIAMMSSKYFKNDFLIIKPKYIKPLQIKRLYGLNQKF